ncbi:hypothetical protein D9615_008555 [Tricholomella constricta]|uniref:DUF6533 domain-containing protein n=1 Tax=Tricholomella constricta TaxID=117010 RepID=A0A8H5H488_9AGAR|nr:hypothetical protein D9615_008555 [Tricholomella constricta]
MPASTADLLKLLETVWYHNTIVQYASVSALTLYVYDYALTLKDEVEYIWKARLTPIKVLFLINRYFAAALAAVTMACIFWTQFGLWADKIVLVVVSALFLVEIGSMFIIGGLWARHSDKTKLTKAVPGTPLCTAGNASIPTYLYALQIPYMGFEFILMCLVLFKGVTHFRAFRKTSLSPSRVISLVLRDSVGPPDLFPLATTWSVVIPTTACSRILINMRKAGASGTIQGGPQGTLELPTLATTQSVNVSMR